MNAHPEDCSPLPWIICEHGWQETSILTESRDCERHVALLSIPEDDDEDASEIASKRRDANALHIVKVVNLFPELVDALALAESALASYSTTRVGVHHHALSEVRNLLAKCQQ